MSDENTPLMDADTLSKARPLLFLLLTITTLVFLAVVVETVGDLADHHLREGASGAASSAAGTGVPASTVIEIVLLVLLGWLIVALAREIVEWNRVIAAPRSFVQLVGTVKNVRKTLHLPRFLTTAVQLDEPWNGRNTVKLLTTNGAAAKGAVRAGEIAGVGERVRIQVYDGKRRRKLAVAGSADRPPHRVNVLP